jgi:hypothetical protein
MTPIQCLFVITALIDIQLFTLVADVRKELIILHLLKLLDVFDDFDNIKFDLNFLVTFLDEPFQLSIWTKVCNQSKLVTCAEL